MCGYVFLTSRAFQLIGVALGLDHDGDGDVDYLDILGHLAHTEVGSAIGLPVALKGVRIIDAYLHRYGDLQHSLKHVLEAMDKLEKKLDEKLTSAHEASTPKPKTS